MQDSTKSLVLMMYSLKHVLRHLTISVKQFRSAEHDKQTKILTCQFLDAGFLSGNSCSTGESLLQALPASLQKLNVENRVADALHRRQLTLFAGGMTGGIPLTMNESSTGCFYEFQSSHELFILMLQVLHQREKQKKVKFCLESNRLKHHV